MGRKWRVFAAGAASRFAQAAQEDRTAGKNIAENVLLRWVISNQASKATAIK